MIVLRTNFRTAVHFDRQRGQLVHAPAEAGLPRIGMLIDRGGARLALADGAPGLCVVPGDGDAACSLVSEDQAPRLTLVEEAGGLLTLFRGDQALTAAADGTIRLHTGTLTPNAFFTAFTANALRTAADLQADRWVDMDERRILPPAAPVADRPDLLGIGGHQVRIAGVHDPFVADPAAGPLIRLHVALPDGAILRLARYRPLIVFAVYGSNLYFDCLRLALESVATWGEFDGSVCIASDRPRRQTRRAVPEPFAGRWTHRDLDPQAGLFGRYDMDSWGLERFGPILYLDTDIVANAPLAPMLIALAGSRHIHLATENRAVAPHLLGKPAAAYAGELPDWFGHWLYGHDKRHADKPFVLGSSGIIGFHSIAEAAATFGMVRALRRAVRQQMIDAFTDQPLVNHALHTLGCGDFNALDAHVDFARNAEKAPATRRGLMHFHAGVGQARVKHDSMQAYMASLGK